MRNEHISGPDNGLQDTAASSQQSENTDSGSQPPPNPSTEPDGHVCPVSRNCKARCLAWNAGGLTPALRCFAEHHDWHAPGPFTNRIKLRLAFKKPIRAAVNEFMGTGKVTLALQIKADFARLLENTRALDRLCVKRIDEDDELVMLEHTKAHLAESLCDLAAMLEVGNHPPESTPEPPTEWITAVEAGGILGRHPGTVRRWARGGKIRDNGKKGQHRRVSKIEILLIKQAAEEKDRQKDLDDLRRDARRIK